MEVVMNFSRTISLFVLVLIKLNFNQCMPVDKEVKILEYVKKTTPHSYHFYYKLSDGQKREEKGELKQVGDSKVFVVTGSFSFIDSRGKLYRVDYSAGENGYKAKAYYEDILSANDRVDPRIITTLLG